MINNLDDLNPEQRKAFEEAMLFARANTRNIILVNLLLLVTLTLINVFICNSFIHDPVGRFFVYFLTSAVVLGSCNRDLLDEADRLTEELQDILKNK